MINIEEFQVCQLHDQARENELTHSEIISIEQYTPTHGADPSIHEVKVEEIDDVYSSVEHSANILDYMHRFEHHYEFAAKDLANSDA